VVSVFDAESAADVVEGAADAVEGAADVVENATSFDVAADVDCSWADAARA
jgi:hypothetical protein